jgi:peptide/nickel transport system substrate-binding protein
LTGGVAAGAALLAACAGGDSGGGDSAANRLVAEPVDTVKEARRGGTMKDRGFADPPTLDVANANNPWNTPGFCVYSALVMQSTGYLKTGERELVPDIAESWEISPDGLQITMKIRQGVKWHNKPPVNGRTLEMDDVLFSWDRFAAKYSGRTSLVNAVDPSAPVISFAATDSRTVAIKLKEPLVYALGLFYPGTSGQSVILVPKETDTTLDLRGEMIGTGPWSLSNYTPSVAFTLKRNPDFYDKDWALVDQVDQPIITEYATAMGQLKAGNIYMFGQSGAPRIRQEDILPLKREEPRIAIYQGDLLVSGGAGHQMFGWLPEGRSPFLDERVRQAVSMAIDRDLFIDSFSNVSVFEAEGVPVETRWNTQLDATYEGWWLDPKSKDFGPNAKYFQHNPDEAKKLLAAAGYTNGLKTTYHTPGVELPGYAKAAEVIAGMTSEVGITADAHILDYQKEYIPGFRDGHGQYEGWAFMSTAGGVTGGHAVGQLAIEYWARGGNAFRGFSTSGRNDQAGDPQVNAMIEKARIEQDVDRGRALVFDIQRYLAKAMYGLKPAGVTSELTAAWPCLRNFRVFLGARNNYRYWIDESLPPFRA